MRWLHIEAAFGDSQVPNGLGGRVHSTKLVAIVTGDTHPDPVVIQALKSTGGTWENHVKWSTMRQAYLVVGQYDVDPNYGDTPPDLDRRLRQAVGSRGISLRIYAYGKLSYEECTLAAADPAGVSEFN